MQDRFGNKWRIKRAAERFYSFLLRYKWTSRAFTGLVIDPPKVKHFTWGGYPLRCNVPNNYMNGWWFTEGPSKNNEMPTVRYLGENLNDGDVFWEIGSAWGCYALIANRMANLKQVVALEPEALNYAETVRNVYLNNFRNTHVFPVAASDQLRWSDFFLPTLQTGYGSGMTDDYAREDSRQGREELAIIRSGAALGDTLPSPSKPLPTFEWAEKVLEMPLDQLVRMSGLEQPTHMVMDVDGGELKALRGMERTLSDRRFRAASIEVDTTTEPEVTAIMARHGFRKHIDKKQRRGNIIYERP